MNIPESAGQIRKFSLHRLQRIKLLLQQDQQLVIVGRVEGSCIICDLRERSGRFVSMPAPRHPIVRFIKQPANRGQPAVPRGIGGIELGFGYQRG